MIVRMVWPNDQSYIIEDSDPFNSHFDMGYSIIALLGVFGCAHNQEQASPCTNHRGPDRKK